MYLYKLFEDIETYQQRDEYGAGIKVEVMLIWAHSSKATLMEEECKDCSIHILNVRKTGLIF